MWIWQHPNWPNFIFDPAAFPDRLDAFYRAAERLSGRVEALSNAYQTDAQVALMLSEVIATSAIEGENLDRDSVRSSVPRRSPWPKWRSSWTRRGSMTAMATA